MAVLHSSQIGDYVADVMAFDGNFNHPEIADKYHPLTLRYETVVDQSLSPFSDEYYVQQVALYAEIAGRALDQSEGELHQEDLTGNLTAANPYGRREAGYIAGEMRLLSAMLALAIGGERPRILDLGAGHGFSSELFAYSGCAVDAVDIDPILGQMARARAERRGLDLTRHDLNFDDVDTLADGHYQAAFFYMSLHHCLKPWMLIAALRKKLDAGGVIVFAGEPINTIWWRHWGLRLDHESIYVARRFGWFESGWSLPFLTACFEQAGYTLNLYVSGTMLNTSETIGIATPNAARQAEIAARARQLGIAPLAPDVVSDDRFGSQCGERTTTCGRPAFRQTSVGGALCYGPYIAVEPGSYELCFMARNPSRRARARFDAVSGFGTVTHVAARANREGLYTARVDLPHGATHLEVRFFPETPGWTVTLPTISRL